MKNRTFLYWICQLSGWGMFSFGNFVIATVQDSPLVQVVFFSLLIFFSGILITHLFRKIIHVYRWDQLNIVHLLPRVAVSSVVLSMLFYFSNTLLAWIPEGRWPRLQDFTGRNILLDILNFSALFALWNIIYFSVKTFERYKKEEIANLELRAVNTEIELNSFKSQMNPHFMFNALNSIRALIDENPTRAKEAITMLSGILRNALMSGKRQTVTISEELEMVEKYLSLEKIRFEHRLEVKLSIDQSVLSFEIPPLMLQTIVENGVKHGISKRVQGGFIELVLEDAEEKIDIRVINSGDLVVNASSEGIGLANTRRRLSLLYGDAATFQIYDEGDTVVTRLIIPKKQMVL
jgi:two-component system, LytTR family, sensor kinase